MARPAPTYVTLDEFLEFDDGTDRRYQLLRGEIVAMAPPLEAHGTIAANIIASIQPHLRPPCRVISEAGIVPEGRDDTYYHADVAVTCAPPRPGTRYLEAPVLLVEVVSPSTSEHEEMLKLHDYRTIASLREILRVAATRRQVELWRRGEVGWHVVDLIGDGPFSLESLDLRLTLEDIYRNVALAGEPPA